MWFVRGDSYLCSLISLFRTLAFTQAQLTMKAKAGAEAQRNAFGCQGSPQCPIHRQFMTVVPVGTGRPGVGEQVQCYCGRVVVRSAYTDSVRQEYPTQEARHRFSEDKCGYSVLR
jgi:hypothetical protein